MGYERYYSGALLGLLVVASVSSQPETDDKKWVWGRDLRRGDRTYTGAASSDRFATRSGPAPQKPLFEASASFVGGSVEASSNDRLRYEVTEPPFVDVRPEPYRPERPVVRPPGLYRPDVPLRPDNGFRPVMPPRPPIESEGRPPPLLPPSGFRPRPPTGRPVLTGPIPSWEQEQHNPNRYREYDKCKCVHSFNCNTPGIKFGSCDVDKQYCCYKVRGGEGRPEGSRPVLVGPGGPLEGGRRPVGFGKPRPVLAGPGGPVDNLQRPVPERPFRPFSDIDRYGESLDERQDRDLEEAYRKGLASAVSETFDKPGLYDRDVALRQDRFRPGKLHRKPSSTKYGLYEADLPSLPGSFARSAPSNITAADDLSRP